MNTNEVTQLTPLDAIHAVLFEQSEFKLSPEQWRLFCQRLDEPPRVIPALRQLFCEPEVFGTEPEMPSTPRRK